MTIEEEDRRLRKIAERRADAKLAFRTHLIVYLVVNAGLSVINYFTTGYPWVLWVIVGWGIGIVAHGMATFGYATGQRERMVEAELARLKTNGSSPS
jgi:hypothetical protein